MTDTVKIHNQTFCVKVLIYVVLHGPFFPNTVYLKHVMKNIKVIISSTEKYVYCDGIASCMILEVQSDIMYQFKTHQPC
jgi:hypothetical protein